MNKASVIKTEAQFVEKIFRKTTLKVLSTFSKVVGVQRATPFGRSSQ
jgi:hypothetical protein